MGAQMNPILSMRKRFRRSRTQKRGKVIAQHNQHIETRITQLQVRTVAAIVVWVVVALLLLNRALQTEWITPLSIGLTIIAVLIYFSPRFRKKKSQPQESASS